MSIFQAEISGLGVMSTGFPEAYDSLLQLSHVRYRLPVHIQRHIDYITPGVKLSNTLKKRTKRSTRNTYPKNPSPVHMDTPERYPTLPAATLLPPPLQVCGVNITPACIKALYNIPNASRTDSVNSLGIYEDGDYYDQIDIDLFFAEFARKYHLQLLASPFASRPSLCRV